MLRRLVHDVRDLDDLRIPDLDPRPYEERWWDDALGQEPPISIAQRNGPVNPCVESGWCLFDRLCYADEMCHVEHDNYQAAPLVWEGDYS